MAKKTDDIPVGSLRSWQGLVFRKVGDLDWRIVKPKKKSVKTSEKNFYPETRVDKTLDIFHGLEKKRGKIGRPGEIREWSDGWYKKIDEGEWDLVRRKGDRQSGTIIREGFMENVSDLTKKRIQREMMLFDREQGRTDDEEDLRRHQRDRLETMIPWDRMNENELAYAMLTFRDAGHTVGQKVALSHLLEQHGRVVDTLEQNEEVQSTAAPGMSGEEVDESIQEDQSPQEKVSVRRRVRDAMRGLLNRYGQAKQSGDRDQALAVLREAKGAFENLLAGADSPDHENFEIMAEAHKQLRLAGFKKMASWLKGRYEKRLALMQESSQEPSKEPSSPDIGAKGRTAVEAAGWERRQGDARNRVFVHEDEANHIPMGAVGPRWFGVYGPGQREPDRVPVYGYMKGAQETKLFGRDVPLYQQDPKPEEQIRHGVAVGNTLRDYVMTHDAKTAAEMLEAVAYAEGFDKTDRSELSPYKKVIGQVFDDLAMHVFEGQKLLDEYTVDDFVDVQEEAEGKIEEQKLPEEGRLDVSGGQEGVSALPSEAEAYMNKQRVQPRWFVQDRLPAVNTNVLEDATGDPLSGTEADALLEQYRSGEPVSKTMCGDGVNFTVIMNFEDGSSGIFKPDLGNFPLSRLRVGNYYDYKVPAASREVAAFHLDNMLGFGQVPITAYREAAVSPNEGLSLAHEEVLDSLKTGGVFNMYADEGEPVQLDETYNMRGTIQQFVDVGGFNFLKDAHFAQLQMSAVFDYITGNTDRHPGNVLVTSGGDIKNIDNGCAFTKRDPADHYRSAAHERLSQEGDESLTLGESVLKGLQNLDGDKVKDMMIAAGFGERREDGSVMVPEADFVMSRVYKLITDGQLPQYTGR